MVGTTVSPLAAATAIVLTLMGLVFATLVFGIGALPFGPAVAARVGDFLPTDDGGPQPPPDSQPPGLQLTHGLASGDVTPTGAVIWARASGSSEVTVEVEPETLSDGELPRTMHSGATAARDFAVTLRIDGLTPDTTYTYRIWAEGTNTAGSSTRSEPVAGRFRTAPDPSSRRDLSFVFGGDLGGGEYCRRAGSGYAIFDAMARLRPDFFIAMGDMIYADNTCPATNPDGQPNIPGGFPSVASRAIDWSNYEQMREVYFEHWRYNRADSHFEVFLSQTPMYALWDDHEVLNDSGALWSHASATSANRPAYATLAAAARNALFAYNPIAHDPAEPNRLYRRVQWGADLDLFLIDTRSYRGRNDLADTPENQKTMLGPQQLQWLKTGPAQSMATWKVVVSSVPLSIPTGGPAAFLYGRDGWANGASWDYSSQTGFERELIDLLRSADDAGVRNLVFLSGDAHQAVEVRYAPDPNGDGRPLVFHEIVAGPLSAPTGRATDPLDPTLDPTTLYRETGFFNFGYVRVERAADGRAHLVVDIRSADGQTRPGSRLDLTPEV